MSKGKKNNNKADKASIQQNSEDSINSSLQNISIDDTDQEEFISLNQDDGKITNLEYAARGVNAITKIASSALSGTGNAIQKIASNPSHAFGNMVVQAKNSSGVRAPYHEREGYKAFFKKGAEENSVTKYLDENFGGASSDVAGHKHKYNSDTGRIDKYTPAGDVAERVHGAVVKVIVDKLLKEQQEGITSRQETGKQMSRS